MIGMGPHRLYWKIIWRLKILPIIRVFAWRVGHEIMPTNMKVGFNRPNVNPMCQRCGAAKETLIHAIKDCLSARATMTYGGLDDKLISFDLEHCINWLEADMRVLNKKFMEDLITLLWGKKKITSLFVGFVKINMDAAIQEGRVGLGVISRDNEGFMLGRGCLKETMMNSAWAELMAIEEWVIMAKSLNLKKVNFEFDNTSIVNKLNSNGRDLTFMGQCAKEICTKLKSFEATVIT
ncbi:hypothetical protein Gogos_018102 [Gossypium gossypioides]|uniref:RNase H type-1 domain-containing protein n=1 Tax=Gossypium gossypioides TaxID=34282 RepID=A0A7J9BEK6_GOSGO|nr:hypothetical protein [Gossypium gossypioides]